jgi:hypothetical protein
MYEIIVSPVTPHPQCERREAEEQGQDGQAAEESSAKDCEHPMSHEMKMVTKDAEPSSGASPLPLPVPRAAISIWPGTMADLPFIDGLQKRHTKQVVSMKDSRPFDLATVESRRSSFVQRGLRRRTGSDGGMNRALRN